MTDAGRISIVPKGAYDPTETYEVLDVVNYNSQSYLAKQTTTGNLPTDTTNWMPLVQLVQASVNEKGIVKVDGSSITIDADGTIHGHAAAGVDTFNGRSGSVLPIAGDYEGHEVTYLSGGDTAATETTVGDVLDELLKDISSGQFSFRSGIKTDTGARLMASGSVALIAGRTVKFQTID